MKKIILILFLAAMILPVKSYSTDLGFKVGLSTPNNEMNNVYNSNSLSDIGDFIRKGAELGYHIGVQARLGLSDDFKFIGGIAWHRFPQSKIEVIDHETKKSIATLSTVQNLYPISAGVDYYLLNKELLGVYATGTIDYVYITNTVDVMYNNVPLNLSKSPTYSRVGFGVGAGVDFNIKILLLNLELKYNIANLIGKDKGEETKSYFTASLGVFL